MSSSQLIFDIPLEERYNVEDFIVSSSNQEAFDYLNSWPNWIDTGVFLFGPQASGKTHLSHIWLEKSKAKILAAKNINGINISENSLNVVVENIQDLTSDGFEKLFHLYNHLYQKKGHLLVTSDRPLSDLDIPLNDLRSRLSRLVALQVKAPDEDLMRFFIMKLFSDLQIVVSKNEVNYLATHLNRDFIEVLEAVKILNNKSIEQKRKITIPFIKSVLGGK